VRGCSRSADQTWFSSAVGFTVVPPRLEPGGAINTPATEFRQAMGGSAGSRTSSLSRGLPAARQVGKITTSSTTRCAHTRQFTRTSVHHWGRFAPFARLERSGVWKRQIPQGTTILSEVAAFPNSPIGLYHSPSLTPWVGVGNAATLGVFASELTVHPGRTGHGPVFDGLACMGAVQRDAPAMIRRDRLPSPKN